MGHPEGQPRGRATQCLCPSTRRGSGTQGANPGALRHSAVVRLRPGDPAPSGPPLGPEAPCGKEWWATQEKEPPAKLEWAEPRTTAQSGCSVNHPGHHAEQGTWGSRTQNHREAGCGRPEDGGVWAAKTVKRPPQQPAQPSTPTTGRP